MVRHAPPRARGTAETRREEAAYNDEGAALEACAEDPLRLEVPTGTLLAYWLGRYHGFLPDDG